MRNFGSSIIKVKPVHSKINIGLKGSFKPIIFLSQLLGVTFFNDADLKHRKLIIIYRIVVLGILVGFMVHEMPTIQYLISKLTSFHTLLAFAEHWSRWIILIVSYLINVKNNRKINNTISLFLHLPIGINAHTSKRIHFFQIFLITINLFLITGYMTIGHNVMWKNGNYKWYTSIIYIIAEFYLTIANIQFVGFLYAIREYYKLLNEQLKKCCCISANTLRQFRAFLFVVDASYRRDDIFYVAKYRELHLNLFCISLKFNKCFSLQILFFIVFCMIEITYSLRSFMLFLVKTEDASLVQDANDWSQKPWIEFLLTIFWGGYYFSCLIQILASCDFTSSESRRTSLIVHELINQVQDKDVARQLQLFSLQLMNHTATFSAGRFFHLDFAILHSIVGTITTYLVIIITFRE